ncbi:MAG: TRAP transporter large permease subunit, partial [Desulfarculaceae bacterium]
GLGSKIAGLVETLSGGNVFIALVITMFVSILLGCGVPPVAAYSLVAIVAVPALIKMGIMTISAHFFCFYFAIISAVTPPVAMGALAGAGIAEANYFRTAMHAFKLSLSGFIIPYLIIFNPILNLHVETWARALGSLIAIPLALTALSAFIYNVGLIRLSGLERLVSFASTTALFGFCLARHVDYQVLELPLFLAGVGLFLILVFSQIKRRRRGDV